MTQYLAPGALLRTWRQRRHLSQMDLALDADISTRHLSFVETGRSRPSREMLLHLAELLDIPLRERNTLLTTAGFAPAFVARKLDDPGLAAARGAIDLVLNGHDPYPALAVDRHWTLVSANPAALRLLGGVDATLLAPPVNVLRVSLHERGLGSRLRNALEWREHVLARLRRQVDQTADPVLAELFDELASYPVPHSSGSSERSSMDYAGVVIPMRLATPLGTVSMFSTTTVFGTPIDITLSELAIESFFPADADSAALLRRLAGV